MTFLALHFHSFSSCMLSGRRAISKPEKNLFAWKPWGWEWAVITWEATETRESLNWKTNALCMWAHISAVGCHHEPKDCIVIQGKENSKVVLGIYVAVCRNWRHSSATGQGHRLTSCHIQDRNLLCFSICSFSCCSNDNTFSPSITTRKTLPSTFLYCNFLLLLLGLAV